MTRKDLFEEYAPVIFALAPSKRRADADKPVSREDVEALRSRLVAISDLVAMKVAADLEFTSDDAADAQRDLDREHVWLD